MPGESTMLPGFIRPSGSKALLSRRNACMSVGPYIRSRNGLRARPSPCSLEMVPPYSSTSVGDLVGDGPHLLHAARDLEVDDRADVQAADRAVAVVGADRVVLGEDLLELRHELREVPRLHAGVFHEGDRLLVALHAQQQPEPRLAQVPDGALLAGIVGHVRGVAEPLALAARLQRLDLGAHLRLGVAGVLDHHDGGRVALDPAHLLRLLDVVAGQVEDELVGHLHRVGPGLQDGLRGLERLLHVVVVDDIQRGGLGPLHQPHLGLEDGQQRALGADDQARHRERPRPAVAAARVGVRPDADADQLVEVVAGHAAPVAADSARGSRPRTARGCRPPRGRSAPSSPGTRHLASNSAGVTSPKTTSVPSTSSARISMT